MISWIQNHLIRHGRWIFLTLLGVIIVAFVFTIGNTPGCTTDRSAYEERNFYGYDLNSPRDMDLIGRKISLSSVLNTGRPIQSQQRFQSEAPIRIALLHLADQIGIPKPDGPMLSDYIKTKAAFKGADGAFSPDAYTTFVDNVEADPSLSSSLIVVVLEEDYRIDQLRTLLSGPGFLLPAEARAQTQVANTTYKLATATTSYDAFKPEITVEEADLKAYYASNIKSYEIGERIKASYLEFPSSKYAGTLTPATEAELREHFITQRPKFVAEYERANPAVEGDAAEKPTVTFELVREAVTKDLNESRAIRAANEAAQNFAISLYRNDIAKDSDSFKELLSEAGLNLIEIAPYTLEQVGQRGLSEQMLESAFLLNERRYYSDAFRLKDGFGILIFNGRIAPTTPSLDEIKDAVIADYKEDERRRLFNENGEALETDLNTKVADGTSFSEAAESLGLPVTTYETFKANEAPREINPSVLQKATKMKAGEISPMLQFDGTGTFVYVEEKITPDISSDDEDFTQAQNYLARYAAFVSTNSLTNELIARGLPADEETAGEN